MEGNQTTTGVVVGRDLFANNISVEIHSQPHKAPPKNIRFKVEKPIQTFSGRETFLEDLHEVAKGGQITVLTQAPISVVAAMGGIGKTETVRMYIQRHVHEYDHIIWIDAEETSFAKSQFTQLAMELNIFTELNGIQKEFDLILKQIFEKLLQNAHAVLLVFDNAEGFEEDSELNLNGIRGLLPKSLSPFFIEPTIIVTSRNQNWTLQKVIQLDLWTEAEVVLFVIRRLGLEATSENETEAIKLGNLFGRLPIAIQAAVAVILQQAKRKKKYGIQNLIDEYEGGSRRLLTQKPLDANMRPRQTSIPMLILWNVSLEKIIRFDDGELANKIICFMAFLSSARIPQEFLYALVQNDCSQDSFENAIELLEDHSLIASLSSDTESHSIAIHRMVQDATIENLRTRTNEGQQPHLILHKNTFLNETDVLLKLSIESTNYIKTLDIRTIPRDGELVENLLQITNHVSKKLHLKEFRDFTEEVASLLRNTNNFSRSIELFERVLNATPAAEVGSEISKKIELKRDLAIVCSDGGLLQKSMELHCQILEEQTRAVGSHHPGTLQTKGDIANTLQRQGKRDEALVKYRDVLQDIQSSGDTQSQLFLAIKVSYAVLLFNQEKSEEALEIFTEVLVEQEKCSDVNTRDIITTNSNIASVLERQGKLKEASEIMLQSISDATKEFGPSHLVTLTFKRKYANLLRLEKKYDLAAPILLELLKTEEGELGPSHPSTLLTRNNLAAIYIETQEHDKALPFLDVEVRERVFGPEHPETMTTASNLAFVMEKQKKFGEALLLHEKICKIRKQILGPNHPHTLETRFNIGDLYYQMKEFDKCAELAQDVLLRREEVLGKDNVYTAATLRMFKGCEKILKERDDLILNFVASANVSAEIGRSLLEASNWNLQIALESHLASNSYEEIEIVKEQDQELIPNKRPRTTTNAQDTIGNMDSSKPTKNIETQDQGCRLNQTQSLNEMTTSVPIQLVD